MPVFSRTVARGCQHTEPVGVCWWCYDEQESAEAERAITALLAAPPDRCDYCSQPATGAYTRDIRGGAPKYTYAFSVLCDAHTPEGVRLDYRVINGRWMGAGAANQGGQ